MLIYEQNTYKMLAVNEAFLKHYGYTSQEILYMSLTDLYPEEEKIPIIKLAKSLKGHAYDGEWHHIKKDGSLITIIVTSHDLVYLGREARIAVVTDISERKRAEEELHTLNNNLLKAQKMAHLGFLDWDLITNEIIPSEEIYNLYGLPLGKKYETPEFVEKVSHPDDVGYIHENLDMALKNIKPYNIDHRIVRPNGEMLWVNAQAELIRDNNGLPVRLLGTVMDITERKKSANEIRKLNQSLEERVAERTTQLITINKELESFSYSISHDLRAPLRAIYGFSQILASRHRPSLNEEGRQYMDYIVEASIRMEQLINDLLNYSRLGRKSLNFRPVSVAAVVSSVHTDFKQKLEEIRANFNVNTNLPEILGDESLLLQIFTNLIENAITYRRTGVPLEINISCSLEANGHILKISDNGIGISKEYWEKIFNIFQRLHTEDKYPGTGIGLATVRKAVHMLNGNVWVESVLGNGSTFFINLPINKIEILNE
jgi:PAS domain S-box-containing protein